MNADLRGMKLYYKGKSMGGIIVTDKGKKLNDREARAFINYCIEQGHTELKTCPEFEDIKDKLSL